MTDRHARLAVVLAEAAARHDVPGVSVAVASRSELDWTGTAGVADDTLFQAGSISKTLTSLAALRLVDRGELQLDTDVNEVLRSWQVRTADGEPVRVTLRQLLSHSAGMSVHGFPGYRRGVPVPTLLEVLDGSGRANTEPIRVDTEPGTIFRYSGGGFMVVQQILADVAGMAFPELAQELVFAPLGLDRTTFADAPTGAAAGHRWSSREPVPGGWHVYPEQAAAGLWTTAPELARVMLAIQSAWAGAPGAILSRGTAAELLRPHAGGRAALGLFLERDDAVLFRHDGDTEGFVATMRGYRDSGDGLTVLTNAYTGGGLIDAVADAVAKEYAWDRVRP